VGSSDAHGRMALLVPCVFFRSPFSSHNPDQQCPFAISFSPQILSFFLIRLSYVLFSLLHHVTTMPPPRSTFFQCFFEILTGIIPALPLRATFHRSILYSPPFFPLTGLTPEPMTPFFRCCFSVSFSFPGILEDSFPCSFPFPIQFGPGYWAIDDFPPPFVLAVFFPLHFCTKKPFLRPCVFFVGLLFHRSVF